MPRERESSTSTATQSNAAHTQVNQQAQDGQRSRAAFGQYVAGIQSGPQREGAPTQRTVQLPKGQDHKVEAAELSDGDAEGRWKSVARNHGMMGPTLKAFNVDPATGELAPLKAGATIYLPSAEEILFEQLYAKHRDYKKAEAEYGEMKAAHNVDVLRAARDRSSEKRGVSYGTMGIGGNHDGKIGHFYSPNPQLAGASQRRTETIDGRVEYKVVWVNDWKCSTFMNDVAYQAGYKPATFDTSLGQKYNTAGTALKSKSYVEVNVADARPGDFFQKFGGTGSNESHNAVLSTFVTRTPQGESEEWTFNIIGAESDRAAEGEQRWSVKKGTNETDGGKVIRFMRPTTKRA